MSSPGRVGGGGVWVPGGAAPPPVPGRPGAGVFTHVVTVITIIIITNQQPLEISLHHSHCHAIIIALSNHILASVTQSLKKCSGIDILKTLQFSCIKMKLT